MQIWRWLLASLTCAALGAAPVRAGELAREAGPRAKLHYDRDGRLRLGTHLDLTLPPGTPDIAPDQLLARYPEALPAPAGLEAHTRAWQLGPVWVVRRTWSYQRTPISGLSLTAHVDARGHVVVLSSQGLGYREGARLAWPLTAAEAEARAYRWVASQLDTAPTHVLAGPGIEATPQGLEPVWRVGIELEAPGRPLELRLDARTGEVRAALPRSSSVQPELDPASDATGTVYAESPLDGDTLEATLPYLTDPTYLTGEYADVSQYAFRYLIQTAAPTETGDVPSYDYPPIEEYVNGVPTVETQTDTFAEVMMYYHVTTVHDFFNALGYFNDDPSNGIDRPMTAIVNYRSAEGYYDNAYYSPPANTLEQGQIVFGQGEATDFTYDSSVIYHEYGHAVVDGTSDYLNYCINDIHGSDCTQGGLNEGTADYFSATLRSDPVIGAYSIGEWLPEYTRDLRATNRCPDDLYGEEHEDGKIWGGGMWDVRTAVAGSDPELAHTLIDPIILAAISTPLPEDASDGSAFSYAAAILETDAEAAVTAGTLSQSQLEAVEGALEDRGLLDCKRFVPLTAGRSKEGAFSTTARPFTGASAAGLQYIVHVPEDAEVMNFDLLGLDSATLYVNLDRPVEFDPETGLATADKETSHLSFTLDGDSSLKLEPSHDYYIAFSSTQTLESALYGYYYTVLVDFDIPEDDASGCGCQHSGARPLGSSCAWFLVLAAEVLFRRRAARASAPAPRPLTTASDA